MNASHSASLRMRCRIGRTKTSSSWRCSPSARASSVSRSTSGAFVASRGSACQASHRPGSSSSTPAPSEAGAGEQLTTEKLDKLNEETEAAAPKKQKMPVGYKNIPSLDAITARLAKARTLSVDGTAKPPEAETIEDPKTPGLRIKAPEHPLENKWYVLHSS